jgi:streptomycin 3"-adenylyltransferase
MRSSDEQLALTQNDLLQVQAILVALHDLLGPEFIGAYLHGSAVLGGLQARSDIDVLAVTATRLTHQQKERMIVHLLAASGPGPDIGPPRPIELTIVVASEIRPWRYPPAVDFQYGEWWREEFEGGEVDPRPSRTDPDLAVMIAMALLADVPLAGPPASQVFDPVPRADFVQALVAGLPGLLADLETDTRNVVLTLARVWNGVVTGGVESKVAAADWALPRLACVHRQVLERARDIYVGAEEEHWEDLRGRLQPFAQAVIDRVGKARSGSSV